MIKKTDISLFNSVLLQEFNLKTKPILNYAGDYMWAIL